jgi:hypothetical protein
MERGSDMFLIGAWTGQDPMKVYQGITGSIVVWKKAIKLVVKSVITAGLIP